jgi:hypothetical protein
VLKEVSGGEATMAKQRSLSSQELKFYPEAYEPYENIKPQSDI